MSDITLGYVRGLNDACKVLISESESWSNMAAQPGRDHNHSIVCKAVASALAALAERMVNGTERAAREMERLTGDQKPATAESES